MDRSDLVAPKEPKKKKKRILFLLVDKRAKPQKWLPEH